ncbi:MAG: hypothetical protein JO352_23135 [Chloroflexi bacterium]|nr:hypothetical protein [Chloroflexota bacterium]MBV9603033.1 hypothetical protein [Chloroflexota bacterium]
MSNELQHLSSRPSIDAEYRFGRPRLYQAPRELTRLTILRSKLGDTQAERAAERTPVVDVYGDPR